MKRYNDLNSFLKRKFGTKIFKVSLDSATTCPNIDGRLAKGGCTFCNDAAYSPTLTPRRSKTITEQIEHGAAYIAKRHQQAKAIAYFQSFTSTYGDRTLLKKKFLEAFHHPDILGFALSTRPDCLDEEWCEFFAELSAQKFFWIELGLQSSSNTSLAKINRWHTAEQFAESVWMAHRYQLPVCAHWVLGLPEETEDCMLASCHYLASLPIDGIKFHNLHVVKGTPLAQDWKEGRFEPMTLENYAEITATCLEQLPPRVRVHRLNAHAPRHLTLAPEWSVNKLGILNAVEQRLEKNRTWQGKALGFGLQCIHRSNHADRTVQLTALEFQRPKTIEQNLAR